MTEIGYQVEQQRLARIKELELEVENLKMVCRRLANAKTIEVRDYRAKRCAHLFIGSPLKNAEEVGKL